MRSKPRESLDGPLLGRALYCLLTSNAEGVFAQAFLAAVIVAMHQVDLAQC